VLTIVGFVL